MVLQSHTQQSLPKSQWFQFATYQNKQRHELITAYSILTAIHCNINDLLPLYEVRASFFFSSKQNRTLDTDMKNASKRILLNSYDSDLGYLCPILHLHQGMNVIITNNVAVHLGIANGTSATIHGFVWKTPTTYNKHPIRHPNNSTLSDAPLVITPNPRPSHILLETNAPIRLFSTTTPV
eukprot:GHVS01071460.1.p1 GENE.GHVS01071460.1~~GHVS01071460.1.p1  ORF type:complete len:180 (+),score=6.15 GHVS01071460.1:191-730(+)